MMPDNRMTSLLRPITVLDTYDASGSNFHEDGLFSTTAFGRLGSKERDERFSYIRLNTSIIHPEIFMTLKRLKSLYAGIISGRRYAIWDEEEKDFFPANQSDGQTGMSFFLSKFPEIVFKRNTSDIRDERINLIEKYRANIFLDRHLVIPAGIRDLHINDMGNPEEDEINDLYRKLLMTANTIAATEQNRNSPTLDSARWAMQLTAQKIHQMITDVVSGKRGWFLGKVGRRNTHYGTRNVITAMNPNAFMLGSSIALSVTDTQMGLLQAMKGSTPITTYEVMNGFLGKVMGNGDGDVYLTNKKTLERELVALSSDALDLYTTKPGIEKLVNKFYIKEYRWKEIDVDGYWLGLLYNDGKTFKLFADINELPEGMDRKFVTPITLADLLYASVYQRFKRLVGTITRYPVTGAGSTYPTIMKVRTTSKSLQLMPLDDDWQPMGEGYLAPAYPDPTGGDWLDSLVPHVTRLAWLGADFDGDMVSSPIFYSENAYEEVLAFFKKRSSFVTPDGQLYQSAASVDTIKLVVANMTGDPIEYGDD